LRLEVAVVAIEKLPAAAPKMEWTRAVIIQLSVSALLVLLSILFCWLAFANWRYKSNVVEGYQEYDRGRPLSAKAPIEAALSWRPEERGPRELLAKLLCDEDKLDAAELQYQRLKAQGDNSPQVNVGLGVIALKKVEPIDKPKAVEALVAEAAGDFRLAAGTPEAEIGLGHCELVLARKLNDPSHYAKAQKIFTNIKSVMDQKADIRAQITRDGLVDYYTGVGKALAGSEKYDEGARDAFRACFQYLPTSVSVLPMANVLALEARRFASFSEGNEAMLKLQPDIVALRNQARTIWSGLNRNPTEKERLREPWLMYSLALAQAWGRAGNTNEMDSIIRDLASVGGFESRMEPFLVGAQVRTDLATADNNPATQESLCTKAQQSYNELLQHLPNDEANRERRVRAFNNLGWMLAFRGAYANNEATYLQAVQKLNEALRISPDDYLVNRNLLVVLHRFRKPPFASAPFLEKCRAAAEKDKQWAEDFEAVKKYLEAK
jgi:tetratricopeptide (TPR) repeat protein